MMSGLGVLGFFGFYLKKQGENSSYANGPFDVFSKVARAEWDTLLFFYGVLMCVGGLSVFGYMALASEFMYGDLGATNANILVGILSAIVDNIPVMFAVLTMFPAMDQGAMAARHADSRCRRLNAVHRLCRWCRPDGPGPWNLHVLLTSEMDLGHCPRLCGQHLCSSDY